MRDFQLDANGDVIIGDTDIATTSDNDEVNQRIRTSLQTRLDEFEPEDDSWGLTRENALGKAYNEDFLRQDIEDVISEQVDENINVTQIDFDKNDADRSVQVSIDYRLPDGTMQSVDTDLGGDE